MCVLCVRMLTLYFILVQTPEGESIYCRGIILIVDVANTPEHTDDQADNPSPSSIKVEGYQPMITFRIRSGQNWTDGDLVINKSMFEAVSVRDASL